MNMKPYSITKLRNILKRNQFLYFLKQELTDIDFKKYKKEMVGSSIKSKAKIQAEMALIKNYWKCKPLHYIRYQLYNKHLSDEELLDYIPPYFHYNFYNAQLFKNIDTAFYSDKYNLAKLFAERGIPAPATIAIIRNNHATNFHGAEINLEEIASNLKEGEKLFIKPTNGKGGTDIIVVKRINNKLLLNGEDLGVKKIINTCDKRHCYIVQYGIHQRADINTINPTSVNTLRAITQWRNNRPTMPVCVMRIGRNGKDVDNSHQGGLSIQVDTQTGKLAEFCTSEHGGGKYYTHPDSSVIFNDFYIKEWDMINNSILDFAKKIPEIPEIAWDIAITDNGAEAIELNIGYGITHLQCCCGGLRRILNIYPNNQ